MSLFKGKKRWWFESLCISVLKLGPIPRHIAIIMDGNRRYAKKFGLEQIDGHTHGSNKLYETLDWCRDLGINEVTVYAFSIENFKRSPEEVEGLMKLIREKFQSLQHEKDKLDQHGVCVRVLGDLTLLPVDIQQIVAKTVLGTQHNNRAYLNVCMPYSSREEICTAVREMANGVEQGLVIPSDVSEELLAQSLYTNQSPDPDIILRTSGEVRLSDFLLMQGMFSILMFVRVLWPEFSIWNLFAAVLKYQIYRSSIQNARAHHTDTRRKKQMEEDCRAAGVDPEATPSLDETECLLQYTADRENRIQRYLDWLREKRLGALVQMEMGLSVQKHLSLDEANNLPS